MLGRLFGSAGASHGYDGYPRDSVIDEEYTRSLLFPDYTCFQHGSSYPSKPAASRVGDFDDWSGFDLDGSKDFRIIVAQDALGDSEDPCVLFDTHPPPQCDSPSSPASRMPNSPVPTSGRGSFNASTVKTMTSPLFSPTHFRTFSNGPIISSPIRNRSSTFSGSSDEHDPRHIRGLELKDDTRNILSCAFGSSASTSSGTKMHIVSAGSGTNQSPFATCPSPAVSGYTPVGYFRKREPIARAKTLGISTVQPAHHERSHSSSGSRPRSTDTVLITKLFSVNLPESRDPQDSPVSRIARDTDGVSGSSEDPAKSTPTKTKKPRAKKTPVFAIILVVHLPSIASSTSRPLSHSGIPNSPIHGSSQSFPNAINIPISSPTTLPFIAPLDRGDARVNALVEQWDIVDRALNLLQTVSSPKILRRLKQKDSFTAALVSKPSKPKEKTMQRTNQINIYLSPLALSDDSKLKDTSLQVVTRIRRALKTPRVAVRSGGWGLWNDELIRIARSRGTKEQNLFLVNLLTSFLGATTAEWIKLLVPDNTRGRRSIWRKYDNTDRIPSRTVILSNDRSVARRLIFLLSSLLAGHDLPDHVGGCPKGHASITSVQSAILDATPPEGPTSLHQSRSPEWRLYANSGHSQGGLLINRGDAQTQSDSRSIRSIPIPNSDLSVRKSSTTTTSTVTPDPSTPVPHFASSSGLGLDSFPEDSRASARLNKIWCDANRGSESSTASTKWGSLLSGFWSKESSASASESTAPSASSSIRVKRDAIPNTVLQLAVNESETYPADIALVNQPTQLLGNFGSNPLPTKLKVNADEGVIDVDIGIPGFLSASHESGPGSPRFSNIRHVPSVASFDSFKTPNRHSSPRRNRPKSRIAGYLPKFHPDYSLQAVKCGRGDLPGLRKEIRKAMLCEPYCRESATDWIDVSTTVIANVQTGSVQRLRLKRKVSHIHDHVDGPCQPGRPCVGKADDSEPVHRSLTECSEYVYEESFSEDVHTKLEPLLVGAVDSVLTRSSNAAARSASPISGPPSTTTLRRTDEVSRASKSSFTIGDLQSQLESLTPGFAGNVVLRALEEVAQSVTRDLSGEDGGQDPAHSAHDRATRQSKRTQDNPLREGIRSWLLNMEQKAV